MAGVCYKKESIFYLTISMLNATVIFSVTSLSSSHTVNKEQYNTYFSLRFVNVISNCTTVTNQPANSSLTKSKNMFTPRRMVATALYINYIWFRKLHQTCSKSAHYVPTVTNVTISLPLKSKSFTVKIIPVNFHF